MGPVRVRAYCEGLNAAVANEDGLKALELWEELTFEEKMHLWSHELRSYERRAIKDLLREERARSNERG